MKATSRARDARLLIVDDEKANLRLISRLLTQAGLTHARPYKDAWPVPEAVGTILGGRATHFDPDVVDAFAGLDHDALQAPIG